MSSEPTGIIFDIKKYAIHDGPGIRTTVFFKGCPMQCWWCHNPESREINLQRTANATIGKTMSVAEVMKEINKDAIFYDESGGGVTFSGGEPLIQSEFLLELLQACKQTGIHTTIDTCGYADQSAVQTVMPYTDLFLFDLKLIDEMDHLKYTGVPNIIIHENLEFILNAGREVHIRFPVISDITDTINNIDSMIVYLKSLPNIHKINLLPYHKIGAHKYERLGMAYKAGNIEEPAGARMQSLKKQFKNAGFDVSIGG
ncbi:MAG: glycyl-radical enzyme activating protein [Calditrichaceae bacterium]|nr:glycyl-radical enzyme activating protein [Calditrichaceae bacterium]